MTRFHRHFEDHSDRKKGRQPGEGPSAERFRPEEFKQGGGGGPAPAAPPEEDVTYNQDGTRLGEGVPQGSDYNPGSVNTGQLRRGDRLIHPMALEQPIGGTDAPLPEHGQRGRDQHPGVAGGPGTSDLGTSGALGGDASNIGGNESENL